MADLTWLLERECAQAVPCPACHAPTGHTCTRRTVTGDRVPVLGMPAHSARIKAADLAHAQEGNK